MNIPLVDLKTQFQDIKNEVLPVVEGTLSEAQYILGREVDLFEEEFSQYCETKYCVGLSSGTEALHLALRALDIGPGDEVITAANSFIATAFAISFIGARPVFVDVDPHDYTLDTDLIEKAITPKTKAIIPVHLYGQPANMPPILQIADKYEIKIIEDACQSHGARQGGKRVGSFGDMGCFSFYPGKNLGAYGDGGAIITNDGELNDRIRLLRNYGQQEKNVHEMIAFNSRLDTLQAAVLRVKLRHLDSWNENRRQAAEQYLSHLSNQNIVLPVEQPNNYHVYHLYVIQHNHRDDLILHLRTKNIHCGIHYPHPINSQNPYRSDRTVPDGVPVATELSKKILSLPIFPEITPDQISYICDQIRDFR